ncbi:hypothetical protein Ami103574_10345 [Aminipila butyrica]|uniref:Uncharacterized protein n=1 Tax=Aminipila butyrica TaxID=433296 RepID=A0A858BRQ7_9FIRM|nr:hypothetical protein [Aminipila butyrica]QIB67795.1 hypothetical protein Ami103574_10345 [Aminipila butyrica]
MEGLFILLFVICLIAVIIGLISPNVVVRWGTQEEKTRKNVLKYYGIGMLLFFVLTGVFSGNSDQNIEQDKHVPSGITAEKATDNKDQSVAMVISKIEALGDINAITLEQSEDVKAVRAAYELLDSEQKSFVTNLTSLNWAEEKLVSLQAERDKEAAVQAQAKAEQELAIQQAAAEKQESAELETVQVQDNYTVYITETGEKYHRDGCQYLRQSKISVSKSDAINLGKTPCSRCNP